MAVSPLLEARMPDIATLEIRLLAQQGHAYPVEMTLIGTQQIFRGQVSADLAEWMPSGDSRVDGQALFDTLFASAAVQRGWGTAHGGQSKQVRLQLRLDAPELHALPWELLRDDQDLLAADADSPFSRYLAVSRAWGRSITDRPIRILAVISNPKDIEEKYSLPVADVNLEEQTLRTAIGQDAQLTVLAEPITLDHLEAELRNGYHILHFVGHGAFNTKSQQAALYFQDQDGNAQRISDDDFAGMLNRLASPPHLVILAACQSAKQSLRAAFSGLGPKLVQIGVPAVIAMQENVSVLTARQFAATFYQRLLAHGTVDLAMNEARGTLITSGRYDAAVPVLFMRLPDGRLWDVAALTKAKSQKEDGTMGDDNSTNRSGGVNIGGSPKIGGDVVGQDKNVKIEKTTVNTGGGAYIGGSVTVSGGSKFVGRDDKSRTGLSGDEVSKLFASIYQQIDARPDDPKVPKADIKDAVEVIEAQVKQGENADEKTLGFSLKSLKLMAKDILDVVVATFTDPRLGIATVVRKVMAKAKES
jgi:hypothetical protein